jgi:hypothetical protein
MSEEPEASRASRLRRLTQCPSRKRKTQARNRRRSTLSSSAKFESKPLTSEPISGSPHRAARERQQARREAGEYLNVTGVRLVPLSVRSRSMRYHMRPSSEHAKSLGVRSRTDGKGRGATRSQLRGVSARPAGWP